MRKKMRQNTLSFLLLCIYAFLAIFFCTTRLYNIHRVGDVGSDETKYLETAIEWSKGNFQRLGTGDQQLRPVPYALFGLSIRLFERPTVSPKVVSALSDIAVFFLIVAVVNRLSGTRWAAAVAGLTYLPLYSVLYYSRAAFLHSICNFFVTGAFASFFYAQKFSKPHFRIGLTLLAGISLSAAANSHTSVAVFGLPFVVGIALFALFDDTARGAVAKFYRFFIEALVFTVGYLTVFVACILHYGFDFVRLAYAKDGGVMSEYSSAIVECVPLFPDLLMKTAWNMLDIGIWLFGGSKAFMFALLFLSCFLQIALYMRRGTRRRAFALTVAFLLIVFYPVPFAFVGGKFIPRCFVNIAGIFTIFVVGVPMTFATIFSEEKKRRICSTATSIIFLLFALHTSISNWSVRNVKNLYEPNAYQWVYNVLCDKVSDTKRCLFTPYAMEFGNSPLKKSYYFGEKGQYIFEEAFRPGWTLDDLVVLKNFSYLFWCEFQKPRFRKKYLRNMYPFLNKIDFYGLGKRDMDDYDVDKERKIVDDFLGRNKAVLIASHERHGKIYRLNKTKTKSFIPKGNLLPITPDPNRGYWKFVNGGTIESHSQKALPNLENSLSPAFKVTMPPGSRLIIACSSIPVNVGDSRTASLWFWGDEDSEASLTFWIAREGGDKPFEGSSIAIDKVTEKPQRYSLSYVFKEFHPDVRIQFNNEGSEKTVFYVAGLWLSNGTQPMEMGLQVEK